jgi:hypothetical protein
VDPAVLAFHEGATIDEGWRFYVIPGGDQRARFPPDQPGSGSGVGASEGRGGAEQFRAAVKEVPAAVRKGKSLFPTRCDRVGRGG